MSNPIFLPDNESKLIKNLAINPEGLRVETLVKLTNLPKRTIYRSLNKLKSRGLIENLYPIWKIVKGRSELCQSLLKDNKIFELHNYSYVLKLMRTPDWWTKRKPRLEKLKGWQFKQIGFGKGNIYEQLINENFVVQTYPESIIIIARKRYYSNSPYEVITEAINDIIDIISYLEERLKFRLFPNGIPCLELRGNDFNRIKDFLAEHCKKEDRRFLVETSKGKVWVDYSEPFGKEANTPDIQDTLERHTKDLIINKPLTNSELQNLVQSVVQNQVVFDKNISLHQEVLREIRDAIKELKEEVKKNGNSI